MLSKLIFSFTGSFIGLLTLSTLCFADLPPAPPSDDTGVQELIDARVKEAQQFEQMNALNPAAGLANPSLSPPLGADEIAIALKKIRDEGLPVELFPEKVRPVLGYLNKPAVRLRWLPWMELLQSPGWLANAQKLQKHENMNLTSGLMILLMLVTFFVKRKSLANAESFGARLYVRGMIIAVRWGGMVVIASLLLGAPFNQLLKLLGPVLLKTITT